ncbi:efflux RND transporter periplasmic adaptor subunit [Coprobacter tertius]|uniref:Efflux RND transporter periplasmic adaptor subunit n=1 Tax=Coprobacter tertius TaxID=2944915 RepID=A0ABT1MGP2_9BACT|nr:efflux RND transporter periplasmic adaptor subunit [Coprobacter tertius]MCP9611809.1 efflux RND transporter periplasmic adaptor subunit [Coprobacter tertius]
MKKFFLIISIVSLIFISACHDTATKSEKERNVSTLLPETQDKVKAMKLTYSDFHHELVANGIITAARKADIRFETSEIISRIYVKNGDKVVKGQKIASLDPFKLMNSLKQSKDNLEKVRLELQDVLISQGYSLKDSMHIPEGVMKVAKLRSNYDNSLIQYEMAEYNLRNSVLYAPFDGVVANLTQKEYNLSGSDVFCSIIGNNDLEIVFNVLESEIALLKVGDKVKISPYSINNYVVNGQISEINPVVDANGMVRIKAKILDKGKNSLYDGMNAKVLVQRMVDRQLVIPKEALVLRTNRKVVFTLKGGRAMWNYVETGMENSDGYVITGGLQDGDSVIYEGNINLAHETPVQLIK